MILMGFLSEQDFETMVCSNTIAKFPVTFDDVKNAKLIFVPDIPFVKTKISEAQDV